MKAYPILRMNQYAHPDTPGIEKWQSAMTFKFVGALEGISHPNPRMMMALAPRDRSGYHDRDDPQDHEEPPLISGVGEGFAPRCMTDLALDCTILASPYASSFGGFVDFPVVSWFAGRKRREFRGADRSARTSAARRPKTEDLPEDMSTTSLVGGGLIAGDSLAALGLGNLGTASHGDVGRIAGSRTEWVIAASTPRPPGSGR